MNNGPIVVKNFVSLGQNILPDNAGLIHRTESNNWYEFSFSLMILTINFCKRYDLRFFKDLIFHSMHKSKSQLYLNICISFGSGCSVLFAWLSFFTQSNWELSDKLGNHIQTKLPACKRRIPFSHSSRLFYFCYRKYTSMYVFCYVKARKGMRP